MAATWRLWGVGAVLALGLGCAGAAELVAPATTSEGSASNEAACEAWVEHMNGLTCTNVRYVSDEMCANADDVPVDMAAYYDCARANARCDGDALALDWSGCQQPTM